MAKPPRINLNRIKNLVYGDRFIFTYHGRERAFQRRITTYQVKSAILCGVIIETFDEDMPCPKAHIMGVVDGVTYHVIVGQCKENVTIVTVYISEDDN